MYAQRFRGVVGNPSNGALGGNVESGAVAPQHGLCGFLVEALDPLIGVRVHDGAAAGWAVDQRDVFLNAVVGLNFEAPPVGPECAADAIFGKLIGDFVGLYAMMKGANVVTKFFGHIEDGEHLIGAVTVHVHENVAAQCAGERVEFEVAPRRCISE